MVNSKEIQDIYSLLEEGSRRPKCRFDIEYEKGAEMELLHLSKMRQAERLFCIKVLLEAESGNIGEAFDTLLVGFKMSNHLKDEPISISQLMRIACDNIIIECIKDITDSKSITPEQAILIMNELSTHQYVQSFIRAMDGERIVFGGGGFERLIQGKISWREMAQGITICATLGDPKDWKYPLNVRLLCYFLTSPIYRPMFKKDYTCYLTLLSKIQDNFNVPYYRVAQENKNNPIEKQIPRYCLATRWSMPGVYKIQENMAKHRANIEICRVGFTLKLHKARTGTYPETLFLFSEIHFDPFSGKELIYKKFGDGFILYSLGPNMKDDSGTPKAKEYKDPAYNDYDIVWECAN